MSSAEPRIAAELGALVKSRASGALHVAGDATGVIYLDRGYIRFAESSRVPDIGSRLIGSRRLTASRWARLLGEDPSPEQFGDLLVEQGLIARDDLRSMLSSAIVDAFVDLTVPGAGEPIAESTWFAPRERHWAGSVQGLDIESALAQLAARSDVLRAHRDVPPGTRPRLSDLRRSSAIVTGDQWTVASKVDGDTTIRDLAWRHGLALYDTLVWVRELAKAGMCTLTAPAEPDPPNKGISAVSQGPSAAAAPALPRRQRGATLRGKPMTLAGTSDSPVLETLGGPFAPPEPDLLRQVLQGLKRLDLAVIPPVAEPQPSMIVYGLRPIPAITRMLLGAGAVAAAPGSHSPASASPGAISSVPAKKLLITSRE